MTMLIVTAILLTARTYRAYDRALSHLGNAFGRHIHVKLS